MTYARNKNCKRVSFRLKIHGRSIKRKHFNGINNIWFSIKMFENWLFCLHFFSNFECHNRIIECKQFLKHLFSRLPTFQRRRVEGTFHTLCTVPCSRWVCYVPDMQQKASNHQLPQSVELGVAVPCCLIALRLLQSNWASAGIGYSKRRFHIQFLQSSCYNFPYK